MINKTLKNKKRFSLYLRISLIILGIIFISLITYKIYFSKESLKHNFQDIKNKMKYVIKSLYQHLLVYIKTII